jgi:hypothetical protein
MQTKIVLPMLSWEDSIEIYVASKTITEPLLVTAPTKS